MSLSTATKISMSLETEVDRTLILSETATLAMEMAVVASGTVLVNNNNDDDNDDNNNNNLNIG